MPNDFHSRPNQHRENYKVILQARALRGIQNVNISYQNNAVPVKYIGMGDSYNVMVPNGPLRGEITIESLLIDRDTVIHTLTGNRGINGSILKCNPTGVTFDGNISFISGYLTSYQSRGSIGEIPTLNYTLAVFGNIGTITTGDYPEVTGNLHFINNNPRPSQGIAGPGSIRMQMDEFQTNRVLAYDLSMVANRQAIYPIGARVPSHVENAYPVEITLSLQYAINDYQFTQLFAFPKQQKTRDITLSIRSHETDNTELIFYSMSGLTLVSETFSAPVQGQITATAVFKSYQ